MNHSNKASGSACSEHTLYTLTEIVGILTLLNEGVKVADISLLTGRSLNSLRYKFLEKKAIKGRFHLEESIHQYNSMVELYEAHGASYSEEDLQARVAQFKKAIGRKKVEDTESTKKVEEGQGAGLTILALCAAALALYLFIEHPLLSMLVLATACASWRYHCNLQTEKEEMQEKARIEADKKAARERWERDRPERERKEREERERIAKMKAEEMREKAEREERERIAKMKAEEMREKAEREERERIAKIKRTIPKREDLKVVDEDYKRSNDVDREFRKVYMLKLLKHFDNQCAHCGSEDNGIDLDHYYVPKCKGGNFILKHQSGVSILNAVPLCMTCNRSKGEDRDIRFDVVEKLNSFAEKIAV